MNIQTYSKANIFSSKEFAFVTTYNNGNTYDFSFDDREKAPLWRDTCELHLNKVVATPNEVKIDTEIIKNEELNSVSNRLEKFLAEKLLDITDVEAVFISLEKKSINIWTVINKLDRAIRGKIYDVEYEILATLQDFQFDFHVICRDGRGIEEVRPSNTEMLFRR